MNKVYYYFEKSYDGEWVQSDYFNSLQDTIKSRNFAIRDIRSYEKVTPVMEGYV